MLDTQHVSFASLRIEDPAHDALEEAIQRAVYCCSLSIGPYRVELRCTSKLLAAALRSRFYDCSTQVTPVSTHLRLTIADIKTKMCFWCNPARVWSYEVAEGDYALSTFLADLVLAQELFSYYPVMSFHAAVVGYEGRIAAIVGNSTAGKSTTAVACARAGFTFYSDERCVLENGILYPFLRALTIRPGGRARLLADSSDDRLHGLLAACPVDCDIQVLPSVIFDSIASAPSKLSALFLIQDFAVVPAIEEVSLAQRLPEVMRSVMLSQIGFERIVRVMSELAGVKIFALHLGSPSDSARKIRECMQLL